MPDLAGYNACLAIGGASLGRLLRARIEPLAREALRGATVPLPMAPGSSLDVAVTADPLAMIDATAGTAGVRLDCRASLRMGVFANSLVDLGAASIPAALSNVPLSVSNVPVTASLQLSISGTTASRQVLVDIAGLTVTVGALPVDAATLGTQLTQQITQIIQGTGGTVRSAEVTNSVNAIHAAIPETVRDLVDRRLRSLFPLPFPVELPEPNPAVLCGIAPHQFDVGFLPGAPASGGSPATAPCLGVATTLLSGESGTLANLRSPLPATELAGLFVDNFLLLNTICCALRMTPELSGLGAPTQSPRRGDNPMCCAWRNLRLATRIDGREFTVFEASVCIDATDPNNKRFVVHLDMETSEALWVARVRADIPISLSLQAGQVVPTIGQAQVDVQVSLTALAIVLLIAAAVVVAAALAVVGGIIGGIVAGIVAGLAAAATGALIGGGIGVALGVVVGVIAAVAIGNALSGGPVPGLVNSATGLVGGGATGLELIPRGLRDVFGQVEATRLRFDDVEVYGRLVPPNVDAELSRSTQIVIPANSGIDLDRGRLVPLSDPSCDLAWRPPLSIGRFRLAGGVMATEPAALAAVSGASYASLDLADARRARLPESGGSILAALVPVSAEEPLRPAVFIMRTGERRFAKGAVWRDLQGRLQLKYAVFSAPAAIRLEQSWSSRRGDRTDSGNAFTLAHQVARTGRFRALHGAELSAPVSYTWLWNSSPIENGASLPGGVRLATVAGDTCTIETEMGAPIEGQICVEATDAHGVTVATCIAINRRGVDESPHPALERELNMWPNDFSHFIDALLARRGGEPGWQPFAQPVEKAVLTTRPIEEQVLEQFAQMQPFKG